MKPAIAIRQITDWANVGLGTHFALIVDGEIVARAVHGMTLADLKRKYRSLRSAQRAAR